MNTIEPCTSRGRTAGIRSVDTLDHEEGKDSVAEVLAHMLTPSGPSKASELRTIFNSQVFPHNFGRDIDT